MNKIFLGLFIGFWSGSFIQYISIQKCSSNSNPFATAIVFISLMVIPAIGGYLIGRGQE